MNIVCIISNSPSATNTATEKNYDELFHNAKSEALKEKKMPLLQKGMLIFAEEKKVYFFSFYPSISKSKQSMEAISVQQSADERWEKSLMDFQLFLPALPMGFPSALLHPSGVSLHLHSSSAGP